MEKPKLRTFEDAAGETRILGEGDEAPEGAIVGYTENTPNTVDAAANADVADAADQAESRTIRHRRTVLTGPGSTGKRAGHAKKDTAKDES